MKIICPHSNFRTSIKFLTFSFILGLVVCVSVFSLIPMFVSAIYAPGATLDPNCLPSDPTCTVSTNFTTAITALNFTGTSTGMNTGDETLSTIMLKLGLSVLSGDNTGDETTGTIKAKLGTSSAIADGFLTSTDWNTFNNKVSSVSPILTTPDIGDATANSILNGSGNVATPSYTFSADTSSGLSMQTPGTLDFSVGGTNKLSLNPTDVQILSDLNITGNITATNLSGTNTGDQNLSGLMTYAYASSTYAMLSNVLALNNVSAFTPTGDYNPATKKYVDDLIDGISTSTAGGLTLTTIIASGTATVGNLYTNLGATDNYTMTLPAGSSDGSTIGFLNVMPNNPNLKSLLNFNSDYTDAKGIAWTNSNATISLIEYKFGGGSLNTTAANSSYIYTPLASLPFAASDFDIELWTKFKDVGNLGMIFGVMTAGGMERLGVRHNANGKFYIMWNNSFSAESAVAVTDNTTWYHIALVRNNTTLTLYLDGTSILTMAISGALDTSGCVNFSIGKAGEYPMYTSAYIDAFKVYIGEPVYTGNFTPLNSESFGTSITVTPDAGESIYPYANGTSVTLAAEASKLSLIKNNGKWFDAAFGTGGGGTGGSSLPTQTGNSGKYLTTDGVNASWATLLSATGNLSVGTTTSSARLTVLGEDLSTTTAVLNIMDASSTSLLYTNNAGFVGIGTTTPSYKLTVSGDTYISDVLTVASTTGTSTFAGYLTALNITGTNTGDFTLDIASSTGLSLTGQSLSILDNYNIPLTASTTEWSNLLNNVSASSTNWDTAYSLRLATATAPLSFTNNILSISLASSSADGYLSSADWSTFNSKQTPLTFIGALVNNSGTVSMTGDVASPGGLKYFGTNITGDRGYFDLPTASSSSATTSWGFIGGTLSNQTDLQNALNLKADLISPIFTTPSLGVATATSINGLNLSSNNTDFNTLIGKDSGLSLVTGAQYNTFLGYEAGKMGTSSTNAADNNTGVGYQTLYSNTTGAANTANGFHTLYSNTSGINNTANGYNSLYLNTIGVNNTASGYESLYSNTTGSSNAAYGNSTLYYNTSGGYNTAIGDTALRRNTTGLANTAVGYSAIGVSGTMTGNYNSALGYQALGANNSGSNNTGIGFQTLYNNITGSNNVALGYAAGRYETGSNAFYVDNRDRLNTAGDKAGALLYGTFNVTPASQTLKVNASTNIAQTLSVLGTGNSYFTGNLGIGFTTPTYKLAVNGNTYTAGNNFITGNSDMGGYVNIGSAPTGHKLAVNGDAYFGSDNSSSLLHQGRTGSFNDVPDIAVSSNYAYLISPSNYLKIINVSDPTTPTTTATLTSAGGYVFNDPRGIETDGLYVYIASYGSSALEIIDVSDPSNPVHAGRIATTTGGAMLTNATNVRISSGYAYVTSYTGDALEIVDISNPNNPTHVGKYASSTAMNTPFDLEVVGNYAYVFSASGLTVIDVSNPASPTFVSRIVDGAGGAELSADANSHMTTDGSYIYVASYAGDALEIVDITNPASPVHAGKLTYTMDATMYNPTTVALSGNFAYVTCYSSHVVNIIDISDKANPFSANISGRYHDPGFDATYPWAITISGNYAYVAYTYTTDQFEVLQINQNFAIFKDGWLGMGILDPQYPIQLSSGARVTEGGAWTNASSRDLKENFRALDKIDVLNKIAQLDITQWNYKLENASTTHIGPIAEDFYSKFGVGGDDKSISSIDPAGIALVGVQALNKNLNIIFGTSSIEAFANSTSTLETYVITDFFASLVKKAIEKLSGIFINTNLSVKKIQTQDGIVIKDKLTGENYCMTISGGEIVKEKGDCVVTIEDTFSTTTESVIDDIASTTDSGLGESSTDSGSEPTSTEDTDIASSTETTTETTEDTASSTETSTTTESIVEDVSSSTPEVTPDITTTTPPVIETPATEPVVEDIASSTPEVTSPTTTEPTPESVVEIPPTEPVVEAPIVEPTLEPEPAPVVEEPVVEPTPEPEPTPELETAPAETPAI
ncbi:MAG: LamG-like jellyroll fold domain-containing protein [Minisyncoccia bacterium]